MNRTKLYQSYSKLAMASILDTTGMIGLVRPTPSTSPPYTSSGGLPSCGAAIIPIASIATIASIAAAIPSSHTTSAAIPLRDTPDFDLVAVYVSGALFHHLSGDLLLFKGDKCKVLRSIVVGFVDRPYNISDSPVVVEVGLDVFVGESFGG